MQIKADVTREELLAKNDVLFEAYHPIEKLKTVASLLYGYPESPSGMDKSTIEGVAGMIEDATKEIEYLIEISNEQCRLRQREKKCKAANILQAMNA